MVENAYIACRKPRVLSPVPQKPGAALTEAEAEAGESEVLGHPWMYSEPLIHDTYLRKKHRSLHIFKGMVYKISNSRHLRVLKRNIHRLSGLELLHGEGSWLRFMRCQTKKSILTHKHLAEFWVWLPKLSPELDR